MVVIRTIRNVFLCLLWFQDFELWDDVGLNIPKPPDLLQLYRNCGNVTPSQRDTVDVSVGVDPSELPGNCVASEFSKKPGLSQQVCVKVRRTVVFLFDYRNAYYSSSTSSLKKSPTTPLFSASFTNSWGFIVVFYALLQKFQTHQPLFICAALNWFF